MRDWPTYWSQRAYAAHLLGDHDRERSYARTMRARHPDQRVSWVIEARALAAMGRGQALDSLFVAAATLDPDVYWSQGAMYVVAGEELAAHQRGDSLGRFPQAGGRVEETPGQHSPHRRLFPPPLRCGFSGDRHLPRNAVHRMAGHPV